MFTDFAFSVMAAMVLLVAIWVPIIVKSMTRHPSIFATDRRMVCRHLGSHVFEDGTTCKGCPLTKSPLYRCNHKNHQTPVDLLYCLECPDYVPATAETLLDVSYKVET